jgi:hypothetical protein
MKIVFVDQSVKLKSEWSTTRFRLNDSGRSIHKMTTNTSCSPDRGCGNFISLLAVGILKTTLISRRKTTAEESRLMLSRSFTLHYRQSIRTVAG